METNYLVPEELRFAVTRKCDGGCRHCYNHSGKDIDRLTSFDINRLIKEIHQLNPGFDRITLTGGEPLLEKEKVLNICRFAKTSGIRVRLVTRGWELNSKVCRELKEAGVTRLQIGLDSSGELNYRDDSATQWDNFHSWLRNDHAAFRKTVEAIKVALDAGIDVSVRYSLCRTNLHDVVPAYAFVSSLGVMKFKFRVLFPDGRAKNRMIHELITGEEMAGAQDGLIRASRGNRTVVEITQPCMFPLPGKANAPDTASGYNAYKEACPCGKTAAYVDANGDVKYCLFDETSLGNICDDPFLVIWNSPQAKEARRQRCPLDASGSGCSSFKILYRQFNNYGAFMQSYIKSVQEKSPFPDMHYLPDPPEKFLV